MSHGAGTRTELGLGGDAGIAGVKPFAFCWVEACRVIWRRISVITFGLQQGV